MNTFTQPNRNEKEIEKFLFCTSPKKARKALMNVFFSCDEKKLTQEDKEEIFLLYMMLENINYN